MKQNTEIEIIMNFCKRYTSNFTEKHMKLLSAIRTEIDDVDVMIQKLKYRRRHNKMD